MNLKNTESLLVEFLGLLFLVSQCLGMVEGEVHFYDFVVSTFLSPWLESNSLMLNKFKNKIMANFVLQLREKNFTKMCSTESMLVANGSFPGPVIQVHKGDTVYVNVHNEGYYGVTLHW